MITIVEAISELLFVRDTVVVPGLGAFVKKPVSAKVNPVANHFAMPSSEITFDANLREDNDLVVNYIAEKNEIPDDEARRLLAMFVSDCFSTLKQGKKVPLKQIGTLYYDWADDLVFEQDKTLNYNADSFGLSDFTPEPVLRSKTKDEIKAEIEQQQKDKIEDKVVKGNDEVLMERIMKVINDHLSDSDFNVEVLTSEVGISRAQLHRKMKEMTGLPVSEFIRNIRLEQAVRLLKEQKVNVTQVAYAVGFSNLAHFSTVFRKQFGVSPTEYIEQKAKSETN